MSRRPKSNRLRSPLDRKGLCPLKRHQKSLPKKGRNHRDRGVRPPLRAKGRRYLDNCNLMTLNSRVQSVVFG
ncbi:unnamed protein product [Calypogeia fissa]